MAFTDTSEATPPVNAWWWDFGDGGTSDLQDPSHVYGAAGDYEVTLLVTNTEGSDDVTGTVTVEPLPDASFLYDPHAGIMPLTVLFTNTSVVGTNPTWVFGDGGVGAGDVVTHTYIATGTYIVRLTVETALCGRDVATGTVVVSYEAAPIASFTAEPDWGCGAPLEVQFTDTSEATPPVDEWYWDFGDGTTSTEQDPLHTYATTGIFTVTFVVTNAVGSDTTSGVISVYDLPVATFAYDPAVGYAPLDVVFTNTSQFAENPTWDFGDGSFGAGDNVTHTYATTGTFTVELTVTSPYGCGDARATDLVQVLEPGQCLPVTIVAVNQAPLGCVVDFDATLTGDAPFTYLWDFGSFGTFTVPTPTVDFGATGVYTGTLTVTNCDGAGVDTEPITVDVTCQVFQIYLPIIFKAVQP
jgi:PKD repeat protein